MRILVTGGAGFIGANIVEMLLARGEQVIILDDFSHASFKNIIDSKAEVIYGDVSNAALFTKLPKVDKVIHQAAVTDTTLDDDSRMVEVNFAGFRNVLDYCRQNKANLVYASSAGVYGNGDFPMSEKQPATPLNIYGYSKLLCDRYLVKNKDKLNDINVVGLRYFNVFGPGEFHKGSAASMIYQIYLQIIAGKQPKLFKHGQQKRDHIYVKDVAAATIKALELDRTSIVNVGTGNPRSFNEIIEIYRRLLDLEIEPFYIDNPYREVYQDYTQAETTRLFDILKFRPQYSLEEGIKDYVANYLSR